jgi:hypothetical protein
MSTAKQNHRKKIPESSRTTGLRKTIRGWKEELSAVLVDHAAVCRRAFEAGEVFMRPPMDAKAYAALQALRLRGVTTIIMK